MAKPLTVRAKRFCAEYLKDRNATAAAVRAGYSARSAKQRGHELLKNAQVRKLVEVGEEKRAERTEIAADRVLEELAVIAFSDIDHYAVDVNTGNVTLAPGAPPTAKRAIASVKYRFNVRSQERTTEIHFWDKNTAIGNAMKHLGLLRDKLEVTGKDGGPIEVDGAAVRSAIAQRLERLAPASATPCS